MGHDPGFVLGRGVQLGSGFPGGMVRPGGLAGVARPPSAGLPSMDGIGISQNQFWGQSQLSGLVARQQVRQSSRCNTDFV